VGREKDRLIEEEERGWSSVGRGFICDNCVREEFLTQYIRESGTERPCDYCDLTQDEADIRCVPFDELMDLIAEGICAYYNSADDEGIPYESAEGGYAFPEHIFSTYELVTQQIGLEVVTERAMRDIVRALPDQAWCRRGFWGLSLAQALSAGWEDFVEKVKHKTRYLFFEPEPHEVSVASDVLAAPSESPEEEIAAPVLPIASGDAGFGIVHDAQEGIPASRVLDAIGDVVRGLGLVRLLAAGTVLFRARVHNNTELPTSAAELGPPTCEQAIKPNRMSPAGIVMFYGAFDSETAVAERFQLDCERAEEKVVSVGAWELVKDCLILDLTGLPPVPSIFDRTRRDLRGGIGFIHGFVEDLNGNFRFSSQQLHIIRPPRGSKAPFFFGWAQGLGTGPCLPHCQSRNC